MNTPILTLEDFSFSYGDLSSPALNVDRLNIREGETVALVGRNGSGKSTLLLSLAGLLRPSKGQRITHISQDKIALVFQTPCLDKKLTVHENLVLFGKVWGMKRTAIDSAIARLNPALQLEELLSKTVQSLSGGQQRRADLARALLSDPAVLFLDEPTVGLDLVAQREFWSTLAETDKLSTNRTIICASHHAAELKLFNRLLFLDAGKIVLDAEQQTIVGHLPPETLEIQTVSQAETFMREFQKTTHLFASTPSHDKVLIHSENAADLLEKIKAIDSLQTQVESVLVRKTQLSDALWQQLLKISDSTQKLSGAGVSS